MSVVLLVTIESFVKSIFMVRFRSGGTLVPPDRMSGLCF